MRNIILFALIALIMVGCRYRTASIKIREATNAVIIVDKCTLDSCEYYPLYGHAGSCRFCKERRQKEWKEFVKRLKEK